MKFGSIHIVVISLTILSAFANHTDEEKRLNFCKKSKRDLINVKDNCFSQLATDMDSLCEPDFGQDHELDQTTLDFEAFMEEEIECLELNNGRVMEGPFKESCEEYCQLKETCNSP